MKLQLVLASQSPRRQNVLKDNGYDFIVDVSNADEESVRPANIKDKVLQTAKLKAETVDNEQSSIDQEDRAIKQKDAAFFCRDARNVVWVAALVALLPAVILLLLMHSGLDLPTEWNIVTWGVIAYSTVVTVVAFISGLLCQKRKKLGRTLAFIPGILLLLSFPVGTVLGVAVLVKINKLEFVASLE